MLARLERKLAEVQQWVDSVGAVTDWPAAIALGLFRTRPSDGRGLGARVSRALFPHIWIRPRDLDGLWLRIDPSDLAQFVIYEEVFVHRVYDFSRVSFHPDTVVDCGAYEGYFTLMAHARFRDASIVAFEPNARNFLGFTENVRRNRLTLDAREQAVSTHDGSAAFMGSGCGGHLAVAGPNRVTVKVVDLRRVIAEMQSTRLLLKLDIEGEEARLLPALLPVLPAQCAVFFEWHQGFDEYRDVAALLEANGFTTAVTRENRAGDGPVFIDAFAQRQ